MRAPHLLRKKGGNSVHTILLVYFLVLRKTLVSYFASIKRGATIIINYEKYILQLMTTLSLSKLRK